MIPAVVGWLTVALSLAAKATICHQIRINWQRRSADGVSAPFFIVGMLSYDFYTLHGLLNRDWALVLGMTPGALLALIVVIQMYRYRQEGT
jgi:Sugar efflux transporter for intercellular exchange